MARSVVGVMAPSVGGSLLRTRCFGETPEDVGDVELGMTVKRVVAAKENTCVLFTDGNVRRAYLAFPWAVSFMPCEKCGLSAVGSRSCMRKPAIVGSSGTRNIVKTRSFTRPRARFNLSRLQFEGDCPSQHR